MERVGLSERETVEAVEKVHLAQLATGERTSIQSFEIEPGATVPEHSHHHEQTGFVYEGELTFLVDDGTVTVGPGDSFTIPGDEPHAAENRGEAVVRGVDEEGQLPLVDEPGLFVVVTVFGDGRPRLDFEALDARALARRQLGQVDLLDGLDRLSFGESDAFHTLPVAAESLDGFPGRQIQSGGRRSDRMYSVVGCSECRHLWVVEGRPETSRCPRCRTRHRFESLKAFAETDTSDAAARVRSSMLADRADDGEFLDPAEVDTESVGIDEEAYLSASGVDADAAAAAGERATDSGGSRSRRQVVLDALSELEEPTAAAVRAYAAEAGVPESYVETALEKLRRAGEVSESDGVYRKL